MKTAEKNATAVQGTAAKNNQTANRVENRPSLTQERKPKKMKTLKIKHLPKLRKLRQTKLPRLRPVAPLQWITNPLTLQLTPQDRD